MLTTNREIVPLEELKSIGRTLQAPGLTLLQAAGSAVGAVSKGAFTVTSAVIAAAEDTLGAGQEKLRKIAERK